MQKKTDGYGKSESDCGDVIEIFLTVADNVIVNAEFEFRGCNYTLACAKAVSLLAKDKTLAEATRATNSEEIDRILGGLPQANKHCANFASRAMADAIRNVFDNQREPWRRLYQKH